MTASALPVGQALAQASAAPDADPFRLWQYGWGMGGMMFGGGFAMLLSWAAAILVIVLLLRWMGVVPSSAARGQRPLDILEERYARGEIDKQEFDDRRRTLLSR